MKPADDVYSGHSNAFVLLALGVKAQTHRSVSLVLFTESRIGKSVAEANQRQSKGQYFKCTKLCVVRNVKYMTADHVMCSYILH